MQQTILEYLKEQFHLSFTQQQLQAIETIDGPVLLLAVPGAGKTTVMVSRIASMIYEHGIAPSSILTITFSKAGARDMRRRYEGLFGQLEKDAPFLHHPLLLLSGGRQLLSGDRRRCSPAD